MQTKYYLLIMLAILVQLGCARRQDGRLVVTRDPSDASRFVCDVQFATFKTPKGWAPNRSDGTAYAILSRSNETYPNLSRMISIDIGKPVDPTARASAEGFAADWHGRVEDASLTLDGETAFRVIIPPDNKTVWPIDAIATRKDGRLFLIIGGARETGDVNAAIDDLVASWKWKK